GAAGKEKRKNARVRPRGVVAHVRAPTASFACQVENLSAGGLFLRTDQQLPRGTPLQLDLVKPGGRRTLHLSAAVAGVITPEEAASAPSAAQGPAFAGGRAARLGGVEDDDADPRPDLRAGRGAGAAARARGGDPRSARPARRRARPDRGAGTNCRAGGMISRRAGTASLKCREGRA